MMKIFGQIILFAFLSCSQTSMTYTQNDILNDLDDNGGMEKPYKIFPMLDDATLNISSNKIYLFADKDRWAIVFEKNGYDNSGFCILKELIYFGNCLENQSRAGLNDRFVCNAKYFNLSPEVELNKIRKDLIVSENAKSVRIRDKELPIDHNISVYRQNNMPWNKYDTINNSIDFPSLTRMLNLKYPDVFISTEEELRACLPKDLPQLMSINEWFHTDCNKIRGFEDRSQSVRNNETFKLIADVLVSKDTSKFKPTKKSNSDWRNWKSGNL
jgi:hypothetical protein